MATTNNVPTVTVPDDPAMSREPARTIGDLFADTTMLQPVIAALVGVVSTTFNVAVEDALVDQITTVVMFAAYAYAAYSAQREARARAQAQAEVTRAAVWAPGSVADIVRDAAVTGQVEIVPASKPPAPVRRVSGPEYDPNDPGEIPPAQWATNRKRKNAPTV